MMKSASLCASTAMALLLSTPATASDDASPAGVARTAMSKIAWIEGEWRGEGWRLTREGTRETFQVAESVAPKLGGLIFAVEGRGWGVDDDGKEVEGHRAFGVISFDPIRRAYQFDSFVREGFQAHTSPEVGNNSYRWSIPAGPGEEMRFEAKLTSDNEWIETGERCTEKGCVQTMEMRLQKINAE